MTKFWRMLAGAALLAGAPALAQQQTDHHEVMARQAEAMQPFQWMVGKWRGEAISQQGPQQVRLIQTERVGPMLSGSVMVVEGRGYDPANGSTEFNALGVINFDLESSSYWLTANANGQYGKFPVHVRDDGFDWSIERGPMTIRYEARLVEGWWVETGFITLPGREEMQFFQMRLQRIGDSDWPLAGSVPMAD